MSKSKTRKRTPSKSVVTPAKNKKRPRARRINKNVSTTGVRLVDTELLTTLAIPLKSTSVNYAQTFSPRLVGTVLPSMGEIFETYKVHSVKYRYVASASSYVAGQAYMGISYDPSSELEEYTPAKICSLKGHWTGRTCSSSPWVTMDPAIVKPEVVRHLDRSTPDLDTPIVLRFSGTIEAGKTLAGPYPLGTIEIAYDVSFAGFKPPATAPMAENNRVQPTAIVQAFTLEATVSAKLEDGFALVVKTEKQKPPELQMFEASTAPISSVPVRKVKDIATTLFNCEDVTGPVEQLTVSATYSNRKLLYSIDDPFDGKPRLVILRVQTLGYNTNVNEENTNMDPTKVGVAFPSDSEGFNNQSYAVDASTTTGDGQSGVITTVQYYSAGGGPFTLGYSDQTDLDKPGALWVTSIQMVTILIPSFDANITPPRSLQAITQSPDTAIAKILARLELLEQKGDDESESRSLASEFSVM